MGFSTTAMHIILFIASVLIALGVVVSVSTSADSFRQGIWERSVDFSEKYRTDIKIAHVDTSSATTKIYVINTGSTSMYENDTSLIIDNAWMTLGANYTVTIVDRDTNIDNNLWDPLEIIEISYTPSLGTGRHEAVVIVEWGTTDNYYFDK